MNAPQRSEEWFKNRKGRITGSNVGAILGLSPYTSRVDVMRRMCIEWQGLESEFQGNIATRYGEFHEQLALKDFSYQFYKVTECGFIQHPTLEWLGASPDGLINDDGILEIKCPYGLRDDPAPKFKTLDEQPHYYAQMQIEMFCAQRKIGYFFQWTSSCSILEVVSFSQEWIDRELPKLQAFYEEYLIQREITECEKQENQSAKQSQKTKLI